MNCEEAKQSCREHIYRYASSEYDTDIKVIINGPHISLITYGEWPYTAEWELAMNDKGENVIRGPLTAEGQRLITSVEGDPAERLAVALTDGFMAARYRDS